MLWNYPIVNVLMLGARVLTLEETHKHGIREDNMEKETVGMDQNYS